MTDGHVNPYCDCGHTTRTHSEGYGPCADPKCDCKLFHNKQNPVPEVEKESNLVLHARREIALAGNDKEFNDSIIEMVKLFSKQGHSGGSAETAVYIVNELLQYRALTPLTDHPSEWHYHSAEVWGAPGGVWQNKRDSRAFSTDAGITYWLIDEEGRPSHTSKSTPEGEIAYRERHSKNS